MICGNRPIPLAELHAAGTAAGHRFEAKRKAYLSPRTVAFNVQGVRLAVHRVTGEIRILHSVHAADIGRLINPMQCRGQIDGAIGMALGWALTENMVHDADGTMVNPSLRNYRIPAFADVPRSEVFFADTYDTHRPARRQVARRVRDQPGRAGDRQCARQCNRRALCTSSADAGPHLRPIAVAAMNGPSIPQARSRRGRDRRHHRHADPRAPGKRGRPSPRWQEATGTVVAAFPGFLHQTVIPPSPPAQVDWVILQRFTSSEAAIAWLHSDARLQRIDGTRAHAGRPRRYSPRPRRRSRRVAVRGVGGDLDADQAGAGRSLPRLGTARRRRADPGARLSGLPARTSGRGRAGRLAGHRSFRFRGQPAGLARFAGTPGLARRGHRLHRGIPCPHRAHRIRPVVSGHGAGTTCRPGLEAEHAGAADALSGGVPVRALGADAVADRPRRPCRSPSRCSSATSSA